MAKNCKFCGTPLEDWMVFCDNCGKRQDGAFSTLSRPFNNNRKDRNSHINPHSGRLSLTVSNTNSSHISRA